MLRVHVYLSGICIPKLGKCIFLSLQLGDTMKEGKEREEEQILIAFPHARKILMTASSIYRRYIGEWIGCGKVYVRLTLRNVTSCRQKRSMRHCAQRSRRIYIAGILSLSLPLSLSLDRTIDGNASRETGRLMARLTPLELANSKVNLNRQGRPQSP